MQTSVQSISCVCFVNEKHDYRPLLYRRVRTRVRVISKYGWTFQGVHMLCTPADCCVFTYTLSNSKKLKQALKGMTAALCSQTLPVFFEH